MQKYPRFKPTKPTRRADFSPIAARETPPSTSTSNSRIHYTAAAVVSRILNVLAVDMISEFGMVNF